MPQLLRALRTLRPWQIAVLAALLLGAGGTAIGLYLSTSDGESTLEEGQQIVPVSRGDLVNDVSLSGNLVYPERETLRFGTEAGTAGSFIVGRVMVSEGQSVPAGAALAALDAETVAELETEVVRALRALSYAEDALKSAQAGATELQLAQTTSELADAELAVQAAEVELDGIAGEHAKALADASENLARARLALQAAQTDLDGMVEAHTEALAKAQAAAADAEVAWLAARERLDDLSLPIEDLLADAERDVASAERALANARNSLTLAEDKERDQVDDAQEARDDAAEAYAGLFDSWLGITLDTDQLTAPPDELIAGWGIDLERIFAPSRGYSHISRFLSREGLPQDDPATVWDEARVYTWLTFYPGEIVAYCDDDAPYLGVCVYQELDDAWDALRDAEVGLADASSLTGNAVQSADEAVARATHAMEAAQKALGRLQGAQREADLRQAQAALEAAEAARDAAEADVLALGSAPDPLDVAVKAAALEAAVAARDAAASDLAALGDAPDPLEVAARTERLALAVSRRDDAKSRLDDLGEGTNPLDLAILAADVGAADAAVIAAEAALDGAVITAPFAGVIASLSVEPGDEIRASDAVLEIVDPTVVAMDGHVDEIDVLFLQVGAAAVVTMDALGGLPVQGVVDEVGTRPASQQLSQGGTGLVAYPVRILLSLPEGQAVPEGLTAVASVVLNRDTDVLLVPLDAVYGSFEQPLARVINNDGLIVERAIVLGNSDDFWVAVTSGLSEGERVVMEAGENLQGGFFGGLGGPGMSVRTFRQVVR